MFEIPYFKEIYLISVSLMFIISIMAIVRRGELTLWQLIVYLTLSIVPIVNTTVTICVSYWLFTDWLEETNPIVLWQKKDDKQRNDVP